MRIRENGGKVATADNAGLFEQVSQLQSMRHEVLEALAERLGSRADDAGQRLQYHQIERACRISRLGRTF